MSKQLRLLLLPIFFLSIASALVPKSSYGTNNKAILIGISQYEDSDINDLAFADEDIKSLKVILTNFSDYCSSEITMLLNAEATKKAIMTSIVETVKRSQKDPLDTFIFMFAGHGVPSNILSHKTNSFLAPFDATMNQFFHEGSSGIINNETFINKAWLIRQLSEIKARSIVMILDSCYSGAKDFGELFAENMGLSVSYRAISGQNSNRGVVIVKNKVQDRAIDKNIAFIASSKDNQESAEYKELRHGALSYCIFEFLNAARKSTYYNHKIDITVGSIYSNIALLFDRVEVRGAPLSSLHQPVLFPIPDYEHVRNMPFISLQGIKVPEYSKEPMVKPEHDVKVAKPINISEQKKELVATKPEVDVKVPELIQTPEIENKTGVIEIITDPVGAEISVDGEKKENKSNCTLVLSEGKHLISLYLSETNYKYTFVVDVKANVPQIINTSLRGTLEVEAYAAKVGQQIPVLAVYVDNKYISTTERTVKMQDLVSGTHILKVQAGDVVKERQVEIRHSSPLLVRYKIISEPIPAKNQYESGASSVTF